MIKRYKYIYFSILTFLWIFFIFNNSSLNAQQSTNESNIITIVAIKFFAMFTNYDKILLEKSIAVLVRKSAHFISYYILLLFIFSAIKYIDINKRYIIVLSIVFCIMIAAFDEFIQLFSIGRSGNIIDVLIDTCGGLSAQATIGIFCNSIHKNKIKCLT